MFSRTFRRVLVVFLGLFLLFPSFVLAQEEFGTDVAVDYSVAANGITTVTNNITLTNNFSSLYATSYTLSLEGVETNSVRAFQGNKALDVQVSDEGGVTGIKILFSDPVVGKGARRQFSVEYKESTLVEKTGEIWEVTVPRLTKPEDFGNYSVRLLIPTSFGEPAYISPKPLSSSISGGARIYSFTKEIISERGVVAAFGNFQIFSFNLNYHLENPLNRTAKIDIAIPPDNAFQKVSYSKLDPLPDEVWVDDDQNWLATYFLSPRARFDVVTEGTVQIFAEPRKFMTPSAEILEKNKQSSEVWQTDSPLIKSKVADYSTPREIYDFVVNTLSYDYDRVKPNIERLGAVAALQSPDSAICMEFTDLFVAMSRAAGIPAREVNGYAYTENPEIQPLSLVADVLHSWAEYWDARRMVWVPVDPTWGNTTGGIDYFDKLDLRHLTFVNHGVDFKKPFPPGSYKLGPNPQKDVFVSFGELPEIRESKPKIEVKSTNPVFLLALSMPVEITNPGPTALYDQSVEVFFDGISARTEVIEVLPPYAKETLEVDVPFSLLGSSTPEVIGVSYANAYIEVPTHRELVIISSLATVLFAVLLCVVGIYLYAKKSGIIKKTSN